MLFSVSLSSFSITSYSVNVHNSIHVPYQCKCILKILLFFFFPLKPCSTHIIEKATYWEKVTKCYDGCLSVMRNLPSHQFSHTDSFTTFFLSDFLIFFQLSVLAFWLTFFWMHLSNHVIYFIYLFFTCNAWVLKDSCWHSSQKSLCLRFHICSHFYLFLRLFFFLYMYTPAPSFIVKWEKK